MLRCSSFVHICTYTYIYIYIYIHIYTYVATLSLYIYTFTIYICIYYFHYSTIVFHFCAYHLPFFCFLFPFKQPTLPGGIFSIFHQKCPVVVLCASLCASGLFPKLFHLFWWNIRLLFGGIQGPFCGVQGFLKFHQKSLIFTKHTLSHHKSPVLLPESPIFCIQALALGSPPQPYPVCRHTLIGSL